MTLAQRCNLVLAFARVLYVNGQATEQTVAAAETAARWDCAQRSRRAGANYDFSPRTRTAG